MKFAPIKIGMNYKWSGQERAIQMKLNEIIKMEDKKLEWENDDGSKMDDDCRNHHHHHYFQEI